MKHLICLIFFLLQLISPTVGQINLKGIVTNDACNINMKDKDCKVFKNVRVTVGTLNSTTDFNGRFSIDLPARYLPGSEVIANVTVEGYAIHIPSYGKFNLPNTSSDVIEQPIIILPLGSLKHLTHDRIMIFIQDISNRESAKANREIARLKSEKDAALKDFRVYFKEFADYHGFTPEKVKELIDEWANSDSVKNAVNNFIVQGARNFYLQRFAESSVDYENAANLWKKPIAQEMITLEKSIKEIALKIDSVCNVYILAGNSAMMAYDFKKAIRLYNAADSFITLLDSLPKMYELFERRKLQIKYQLAIAFCEDGTRTNGTAGLISLAISEAFFRYILEVYTKEDFPQYWGRSQINLAIALVDQGIRTVGSEGMGLLAQGEAACHSALEVFTKEEFPEDWATTKNNLGTIFFERAMRAGDNEMKDLLAQAVTSFQAALEIFSKKDFPQLWAGAQNNLAVTLKVQGGRLGGKEGAALLSQAIVGFRAALEIRTKAHQPQEWAQTQNNLGTALSSLGMDTGGQEGETLLAQAVVAYRNALEITTREYLPLDWAMTQNNLGKALSNQGIRVGAYEGSVLLAQAVLSYRAALEIFTKESMPINWAKQWELAIEHFENMRSMYPAATEEKINIIKIKMKQQ